MFRRSGYDLLSRVLRQSTIGAKGFNIRVRNGIVWDTFAMTTRSSKHLFSEERRKTNRKAQTSCAKDYLYAKEIKPIELLVQVSWTHCCAYTPCLLTWWSITVLMGIPSFKVGFPLRCIQRLSLPYLATQRCPWQNNWYTRGMFISVLSY